MFGKLGQLRRLDWMLLGKSVTKPRPRRIRNVELISCTSFKCLEMPRKKTKQQGGAELGHKVFWIVLGWLEVPGELTSGWWSQHITKRITPLLLVGAPFCFPSVRFFSPCSSTSRKEPRGCSKDSTGTCPIYSVFPHAVHCVNGPGWAAVSSHSSAALLTVSLQSQHCPLFLKDSSSVSKGALNLLIWLGFSNTSYLTEWRKTSNSSRRTSSPSCNILIFSWLQQTSLKFSRI